MIAPAQNVARKPAKLTFEEAAGIPTASLAAWRTLITNGDIKKGQRVLIHGGAGGVGSTAVQLAHWRGAHVIATASERNHEYLKSIGADEVIDYRTTRFEDVVKNVDVVLDTVGGDTLQRSPAVLREGGTLLTIVGMPPAQACSERKLRCPTPSTATREQPGEELTKLGQLFDSGDLKMHVEAVFPLEQATKALDAERDRPRARQDHRPSDRLTRAALKKKAPAGTPAGASSSLNHAAAAPMPPMKVSESAARRHSRGVTPWKRRSARNNVERESKPTTFTMSSTASSLPRSNRPATVVRLRCKYSCGVTSWMCLNSRRK